MKTPMNFRLDQNLVKEGKVLAKRMKVPFTRLVESSLSALIEKSEVYQEQIVKAFLNTNGQENWNRKIDLIN